MSRNDAPQVVVKMLCAMNHRAHDGAAVAWNGRVTSASSPASLDAASSTGHSAIGYGLTGVMPGDILQPIRAGEGWFCLNGRIVADQMLIGGEKALRVLEGKLNPAGFSSIQREVDGAYSAYFCAADTLLVARDSVGLKSTFMGRGNGLVAVASDRKALWAIGIEDITSFPPGGCLEADPSGTFLEFQDSQSKEPWTSGDDETVVEELSRALVESVSIQTARVSKLAVGFSGGIDSTVLAKVAKDAGVDVLLVTVGLGRTPEMIQAQSTAEEIGLPIIVKQFSEDDVEQYLDRVIELVEESNLMKVSIALAVHWIAELALVNGCPVVMLGQGSDELFGGYKRFATIMAERGKRATLDAISESVRHAYEVNYQRDDQAVSSLGAELRLPFATKKMTEIAAGVPLEMKVRSSSDNIRKWVLREAAVKFGVPSAIAMKPKKAIQHASGIEKAIRGIAKRHRQSPRAY